MLWAWVQKPDLLQLQGKPQVQHQHVEVSPIQTLYMTRQFNHKNSLKIHLQIHLPYKTSVTYSRAPTETWPKAGTEHWFSVSYFFTEKTSISLPLILWLNQGLSFILDMTTLKNPYWSTAWLFLLKSLPKPGVTVLLNGDQLPFPSLFLQLMFCFAELLNCSHKMTLILFSAKSI